MWSQAVRKFLRGKDLQTVSQTASQTVSQRLGRQRGFSLLEVLLALSISGVLLASALTLITGVWRSYPEDKHRLELRYSLLAAGRMVADAIRTAKTVELQSKGRIKVVYWDNYGQLTTDYYYVADKDYDGITDLYREHVVPNPVASWISDFACDEVEPGLWRIKLEAAWGGQTQSWQVTVRRRTVEQ